MADIRQVVVHRPLELLAGRWQDAEGVLGFEYNGDCWAVRIVGQRLTTTTEQASKSVFVQFELNGLARLGTNPIDVLKRSVPGYLTGNEPSMRPASVTDYFPEF
jgi:Organic solvent tolerance protein OstA